MCRNLFSLSLAFFFFPPRSTLCSDCSRWAHMGNLKYSLDNVFQHLNVQCWIASVSTRSFHQLLKIMPTYSFLVSLLWGSLTLSMLSSTVTLYANDIRPSYKPVEFKEIQRIKMNEEELPESRLTFRANICRSTFLTVLVAFTVHTGICKRNQGVKPQTQRNYLMIKPHQMLACSSSVLKSLRVGEDGKKVYTNWKTESCMILY